MTRQGHNAATRGRDRQGRFAPSIQVSDPLADVRNRPGGPKKLPFKAPTPEPLPEPVSQQERQRQREHERVRELMRGEDPEKRHKAALDPDTQDLRERMAACGLEFTEDPEPPKTLVQANVDLARDYLERRRAGRPAQKAWTEGEFELAANPLVGLWHRRNTPKAIRASKRAKLADLTQARAPRPQPDPLREFLPPAPGFKDER